MVLLDLNMPRVDGRQVLQEIRGSEELRSIPVVVMTTSNQEADIVRSYDVGANSYLVKPVDIQGLSEALASLENYWFEIVLLPPQPASSAR